MIDPTDQGNTLPLPVTAHCPHSLKFVGDGVVYTAHLVQDLVGDWQLLRSWGQARKQVASVEEGVAALAALAKKLGKQGFAPVPFQTFSSN